MEVKVDKIRKYAEWVIALILVILTGYFFASLALNIIDRKFIVTPRIVIVKKNIPEKEKTKTINEYLTNLKALLPEAVSFSNTSSAEGFSDENSEGQQNVTMKLVATILGEGASLAVINMGDKDEVVEVGQTVLQYTVKKIDKNKVILQNGGRDLILRMKFGEPEEERPSVSETPIKESKNPPGIETKEISRREFEESINPPDRVAREIGFAPVSSDGRPYGIQLTFVKPGSFLQKLGFLPGDILKTVNRKPVYSPEDGMMVYQMMKNEDTVDFNIDRGGRVIQLQIKFK